MSKRTAWPILPLVVALFAAPAAWSQTVRIAQQFGISYLPLMVVQEQRLLEQEGATRGLTLEAEWVRLSSGAPINDALLSGNLEFAGGGVGPLLTIWAKTQSNLKVKGVAALNAMPMWLNSSNPAVHSIRDLTEQDRIALPAVKVSVQAVALQMAARQVFGEGQQNRLDHLTVSMSHPDGVLALLGGHSPITAHFTSAPFMYQEVDAPGVHRILNSYDVLGGPHTFNVMWTTTRYHDANPQVVAAFLAALERAMQLIRQHPADAAAVWLKSEQSRMPLDQAEAMIVRPENEWTTAPRKIMAFARFMYETDAIPVEPARWQDVFFPELQAADGS